MAATSCRLLPVVALAWTIAPRTASADGKDACVGAYAAAQANQRSGAMVAAREQLLVCSQEACPPIVRTDCVRWLREVEDAVPTIIFRARDDRGADLFDVRVAVDGAAAVERLDGRPVVIDPGPHTISFQHAGQPSIEQKLLAVQGEKNRVVTADWSSATDASPNPPSPAGPPPHPSPGAPHSAVPATAYVFGGLGIAGLAVFASFGIKGWADLNHLRSSCAPGCSASDVDSMRTELHVADVGLLVGIASFGVATWIVLASQGEPKPTPRGLQLAPGGARLSF